MNAFDVVRIFEEEVAKYTGAPYAVAVESCSNALLLCCEYHKVKKVQLPANTYVSVPNAVIRAGGKVRFVDKKWRGAYRLHPYPIVDAAKRFTSGMYETRTYMCVSFHGRKILNAGRGGMILTDDAEAVEWFKRARFDGRKEGVPINEDDINVLGHHVYMTPEQATAGLSRLMFLPQHNEDMPAEDYGDLRKHSIFKEHSYE
jgi:dTDP-4-amino-4,6-dideoxygalactose transaminase